MYTVKSTGLRCKNPSVRDTDRCRKHGGRAWPLITMADRRRLDDAVNEHLRAQGYDV